MRYLATSLLALSAACAVEPTLSDPPVTIGEASSSPDYDSVLSQSCPEDVPFALPQKIDLTSTPVALNPDAPEEVRLGALTYRGGFVLESSEPAFGGLSGMDFLDDDTLLFVSDQGRFFWVDIQNGEDGSLQMADAAYMAEILDEAGDVLPNKRQRDAEGLAWNGETAFVSLELRNTILAFNIEACGANARGIELITIDTDDIDIGVEVQTNREMEALAVTEDGRLIAGLETSAVDGGAYGVYDIGAPALRFDQRLPPSGAKSLTGADVLDGRLYTVHRSYDPMRGNRIALQVKDLETGESEALAEIRSPLSVDNFEAIAVRQSETGVRLVIASDNNFSNRQRTLLFVFDLDGGAS